MAKGNTLTGLIPSIYAAMDVVSREQVGFIPAVGRDAKADQAAKGQTVRSPVTPEAKAQDIEPGVVAPTVQGQNIGYKDVTITKSRMVPLVWNGEEQLALNAAGQTYNVILADQFTQALRTLTNEIDTDLAGLFYGSSRAVGEAGKTPFGVAGDLSDFALARQVLEDNGAPQSDLQMVLGSGAIANLRGKQSVLFKMNEAGTDALLREGTLGRVEGFSIHNSAGVRRRKLTTCTGWLVNGEKKEGERIISIDTGNGAIAAGHIVKFAGDEHQYVVAAATASSITLGGTGLMQDVADNAEITVIDTFTPNMAFDRRALLLATRVPAMPKGGDAAEDVMEITDPVSGLTFSVALYKQYKQVSYEIGIAWGVASVKEEHAALLLG